MKADKVLKILKINRVTLYRYLRDGKIQATKLPSGHYDYDEKSIYLASGVGHRGPAIYINDTDQNKINDKYNALIKTLNFGDGVVELYSDVYNEGNDYKNLRRLILDLIYGYIDNLIIDWDIASTSFLGELLKDLCKEKDCKLNIVHEK